MADQPTIPVRLSREEVAQLEPDTHVILLKDLKGYKLEDVRLVPLPLRTSKKIRTWKVLLDGDHESTVYPDKTSTKQRKKFAQQTRLPPHERKALPWSPRFHHEKKVTPDGTELGQVSMQRLYGIKAGTDIVFLVGDQWTQGNIQPYLPWREIERVQEKAAHKERYAQRRWNERPTASERLDDWEDSLG